MRWNKKQKPVLGEKRTRSSFLILPKTIGKETRWLEYVRYEQEYVWSDKSSEESYCSRYVYYWKDVKWLD